MNENRKNGRRCALEHCRKSPRNSAGIKMFEFPSEDSIRGKIWREVCNQQGGTKKLFLCENHFPTEFIGSKKLKKDAVPSLFLNSENDDSQLIEIEDFELLQSPKRRRNSDEIEAFCSNCERNIKNTHFYLKKLSRMEKVVNILRKKLRLRSKFQKQTQQKLLKLRKNYKEQTEKSSKSIRQTIQELSISEKAKTFSNMLTKPKSKVWDKDEKLLCQNIFYRSQAAYKFLRDGFELNMPHLSSLFRWAPVKNLQPGFENTAFPVIKARVSEMTGREKNVIMVFDEVAIRRDLVYNSHQDIIDGLEDSGFERTSKVGKNVCVFMIRGLFDNLKCVLNYFVSETNIKGSILNDIVKKNISDLNSIGLNVLGIVCDQGSNNRNCFKCLGAIDVEKPFFFLNENKIFTFYDFPHLLKNLRNLLICQDILTPDGKVSFDVVRELYDIEKDNVAKMCPNLTEKHINSSAFDKMRVSLVTQVISRTTVAAIRTLVETKKLKKTSNTVALSTASFFEQFDKLMDCMNSGSLFDKNPFKSAIQEGNAVYKHIEDSLQYVKEIQRLNDLGSFHHIYGIRHTLNATLGLYHKMTSSDQSITYILTKRLNQDVAENLFSVVRAMGGNNKSPSVYELNILLAKVMSSRLLQCTPHSNCLDDEDIPLDIHFENKAENDISTDPIVSKSDQLIDMALFHEEYQEFLSIDTFDSDIRIELTSLRYFSGYVVSKMLPKLNCPQCEELILKRDEVLTCPSEFFLFAKNYAKNSDFGNLRAPSDLFFQVCKIHSATFEKIFKEKKTNTKNKRSYDVRKH
ncbi:transposable element P transposase [Episyrphus balteatus]|uniref:transposable element P transposase n=1 Tax=Episyrphus balteatus TaxID=286459 RepID=UPI0024864A7F|nr:transposable element P transposase [Episyrphus balteatus]